MVLYNKNLKTILTLENYWQYWKLLIIIPLWGINPKKLISDVDRVT